MIVQKLSVLSKRCDIFNRCFHKIAGGPDDEEEDSDSDSWAQELDFCTQCIAEGQMKVKMWTKRMLQLCEVR